MRAVNAALKLYRVVMDLIFFISCILLGIGLAMDAFAISIADGISKPEAELGYVIKVTAVYALFQFVMPLIGWFLVHEAAKALGSFNELVPWIALILLAFLGGRMILDGARIRIAEAEVCSTSCEDRVCSSEGGRKEVCSKRDICSKRMKFLADIPSSELTGMTLFLQGIATSIDALSTGFAIARYDAKAAFVCSSIIAAVTWIMCMTGMRIGSRVGKMFSAHATIVGGVILVFIGTEVFAKGVLL